MPTSYLEQVIHTLETDFSISELAKLTDLSRISVKKYCNYLEDIDELVSYLFYPANGRPMKMYRDTTRHLKI